MMKAVLIILDSFALAFSVGFTFVLPIEFHLLFPFIDSFNFLRIRLNFHTTYSIFCKKYFNEIFELIVISQIYLTMAAKWRW